jgi:hypothetical protein
MPSDARSSGEFRLRKVFMKLGISSPAELIRFDIAQRQVSPAGL